MPFLIILGLAESKAPASSFSSMSLEAELVYDVLDADDNLKPVPFMVRKPLEWFGTLDRTSTVDQPVMIVSAKISVLSSQHAQIPFRIRFRLKEAGPTSSVVTDPIRVFSKPNQINSCHKTSCSLTPALAAQGCQSSCLVVRKTSKKRTFSEILNDRLATLSAISQKQQENLRLLHQLRVAQLAATAPHGDAARGSRQDPLEIAFHALLAAYAETPESARPGKVRRIVRKTTGKAVDVWGEIVSLLASSIAELEGTKDFQNLHGFAQQLCPHVEELQRIEALWQSQDDVLLAL